LLVALPLATGCASRTAPFDSLDDASMTILKLQGDQAAGNPLGAGGFPIPIPGMTPEQQQALQQQLGQIPQQITQMIPGLPQIPGLPGTQPPRGFANALGRPGGIGARPSRSVRCSPGGRTIFAL
jgi:hypothetical protein